MVPVKFDEAYTYDLGAGGNPNTSDLPFAVAADRDTPGVAVMLSCWAPSPEELEEIVKTGRVWIGVMASLKHPTQPPIWVMGTNPILSGQMSVMPQTLE